MLESNTHTQTHAHVRSNNKPKPLKETRQHSVNSRSPPRRFKHAVATTSPGLTWTHPLRFASAWCGSARWFPTSRCVCRWAPCRSTGGWSCCGTVGRGGKVVGCGQKNYSFATTKRKIGCWGYNQPFATKREKLFGICRINELQQQYLVLLTMGKSVHLSPKSFIYVRIFTMKSNRKNPKHTQSTRKKFAGM